MTIFEFDHDDRSFALDILTAYAVTEVSDDEAGHDVDLAELPVSDFRDAIARQLAEQWADKCETRLVEPAELHLARFVVRALLPDPDGDEQGVEQVLRRLWTTPGSAAA